MKKDGSMGCIEKKNQIYNRGEFIIGFNNVFNIGWDFKKADSTIHFKFFYCKMPYPNDGPEASGAEPSGTVTFRYEPDIGFSLNAYTSKKNELKEYLMI